MINIFALKLIHDHNDKGHEILLASATNELIVRPIARRLEIKNVIATNVGFQDNKCTGAFIPPSALGAGKLELVEGWMKENDYNFDTRNKIWVLENTSLIEKLYYLIKIDKFQLYYLSLLIK